MVGVNGVNKFLCLETSEIPLSRSSRREVATD